jgi:ArsR family transcriptional regulator, arsenate/arsenite/antimonite-responsive transcriptional repressor
MNTALPILQPLCCGPDLPALDLEAAEDLAVVFKALADPTRVGIVSRLASGESCCVCDLTNAFDLSQPTVSHHLRILRDAGLVDSNRRGTYAYYRLVPSAIEKLQAVFQPAPRVAALSGGPTAAEATRG